MDHATRQMASYWAPMIVFGAVTTIEGYAPTAWYPWLYLAKIVAVVVTLVALPRSLRDITPSWRHVPLATAFGLIIFAQWILIDRFVPYPHLGTRTAFNPFAEIADPIGLATLLIGRFLGLVILVPIIEETLWRNFALRYLTNPDYEQVPIGQYTTAAFWTVAGASAITHPEWLVALVAGILFAVLVRHTRSLFPVIVAHAVANLALGVYIVTTGDWKYW
jgi:CAAX prenyl protease-like protein